MVLGNKLFIKQEIEPIEFLSGLESGNKYSIFDEDDTRILYAYEEQSNFLSKQILSRHRNVNLNILDQNGNELFSVNRPFYFLNSKADIKLNDGNSFGKVVQKKWLGTKQFDFITPEGKILFSCVSKLPSIWTFKIVMNNQEVAEIKKKWSGAKELATDADNFAIDFYNIKDDSTKYAILITAFIVDLRNFEN